MSPRWFVGRLCDTRRQNQLLLLERDPRDQVVSNFYESTLRAQMWNRRPFQGNLSSWLPQGLDAAVRFNSEMRAAVAAVRLARGYCPSDCAKWTG